jgi:hypothetical protein
MDLGLAGKRVLAAGGWSSAAWLTSIALGVTVVSGIFLHRRERRRLR